MYRLYATETENPLKFSAYRNIFNYEFNLAFFRPKKDRCEKCVEHEQLRNPSEQQNIDYSMHRKRKTNAHNERNKDRDVNPEIGHQNKSVVAEFDLENVFQLPIANASILFYLRKFGAYNLTVVVNKIVYNVFWNEFVCGRAGTHLASALVKALKRIVVDNPEMELLTLWSDSCVPQNRNSFMSAALQEFLNSDHSGNLRTIEHKYSEAGHGEVQDVDCAHSVIEKFLRGKFIYSPVSLLKEFRKLPSGKSQFVVLEMEDSDYFDYESLAQASKYTVIPHKTVVQLTYKKNESKILFKLDLEDNFNATDILLKQNYATFPELQGLELHSTVSAGKMADIQKMYAIMPEIDRVYYQNGFKKVMGQLLPETLTSMTQNISEINNAGEGPNASCVVAGHIVHPKSTKKKIAKKAGRTAGHGNKQFEETVNAVERAKKKKKARCKAGLICDEAEVDHLKAKQSKNLNVVESHVARAKQIKKSRRTVGIEADHIEDVENRPSINGTNNSKNVKVVTARAKQTNKTKRTAGSTMDAVSCNSVNFAEHFPNPKRKSTATATILVDSSKNVALSLKPLTISLRNRNKKILENVDATGDTAASTGGVHTDQNPKKQQD